MSQNNDTTSGMVLICRHPGDYEGGPFPADKISNVHWGCVSGGVNRRQNGFSLYGYAPYEDVMDIVACSGRHNFGYNDMKICITAANNKDNPKYRAAYYSLVEKADEKSRCGIAGKCPPGAPSCTKRIREIMAEKKTTTRRELRNSLLDEGYKTETIRDAIKNLRYQEFLEAEGDWRSPSQIIRLK